jgi:hypothetical protein
VKRYLACTLGLVLAACSGAGPAAPDPGPPMIHPIPTRGGTTGPVVVILPRFRRIHVHYSN